MMEKSSDLSLNLSAEEAIKLIQLEARVDVFAQLVKDGTMLSTEAVLRLLRTPKCIEVADYIHEQDTKMCENFLKNERRFVCGAGLEE